MIFWKAHEGKFKALAKIAKQFLEIPASSAAVERMFSISGHILSCKRTKMSIRLFCLLVFLKYVLIQNIKSRIVNLTGILVTIFK